MRNLKFFKKYFGLAFEENSIVKLGIDNAYVRKLGNSEPIFDQISMIFTSIFPFFCFQ